jgi:TRAP-type C4-dicarboxylate transport system permease small subunit
MKKSSAEVILHYLTRIERGLTTAGFIAMTSILFADVVARELTNSGLITARQYAVYANILVVMFGLGIASSQDAHLRPRFIDNLLPSSFKEATKWLKEAVTAAFAGGCAILSTWITLESFQLTEVSALTGNYIAPFMAIMPIGFAFMTLRHLLYACWPDLAPEAEFGVTK